MRISHLLYVVGYGLAFALPVVLAWLFFAWLLSIPNEIVRAVAIWLFIIVLVVMASSKSYGESALDRTFKV